MEISTIIIDNFYVDPYETREFALSQEFDVDLYRGHTEDSSTDVLTLFERYRSPTLEGLAH